MDLVITQIWGRTFLHYGLRGAGKSSFFSQLGRSRSAPS